MVHQIRNKASRTIPTEYAGGFRVVLCTGEEHAGSQVIPGQRVAEALGPEQADNKQANGNGERSAPMTDGTANALTSSVQAAPHTSTALDLDIKATD